MNNTTIDTTSFATGFAAVKLAADNDMPIKETLIIGAVTSAVTKIGLSLIKNYRQKKQIAKYNAALSAAVDEMLCGDGDIDNM